MILILTEPDDPHANLVEAKLRRRGARILRFDYAEYPEQAKLSIDFQGGKKRVLLSRGNETFDLAECTTGWLRRPRKPQTSGKIANATLAHYTDNECMQVLLDTWNTLGITWLPGPIHAIRRADCKQLQLQLATELGMEIPPTLITNDPDAFLEFYRQHDGNVIDKLPSTTLAATVRTGNELMRFTQATSTRDVGYARRLRYSPVMFQAKVPKKFELRITVVGQNVLAAEIHSQSTKRTQLDWRHYDSGHTPYRAHRLPDEVRRACLALVARLGLRFGAIDMIVTPDDRYVFLEINPSGQWMWIEDETGLPISDALCETLLDPTAAPSLPFVKATCELQEITS
jgi:glutathione synthase/RimK-type ligase-like ATP-grasp enzyme